MNDSMTGLDTAIERCDRGEDGFRCRPVGSSYELLLWGHVPDHWAGNLALHCFASMLNIESADALRVDGSRWAATFSLTPRTDRLPHAGVDFLAMARRAPRLVPSLPEACVDISAVPARDCAAFARVSGSDSIGLLAEVLRRFAAFGLYPRRFKLEAREGQVDDWFWLEPGVPLGHVRTQRSHTSGEPTAPGY